MIVYLHLPMNFHKRSDNIVKGGYVENSPQLQQLPVELLEHLTTVKVSA